MKYQVKDPQGQMHVIDGPEGATPEQVIAQAQKLIPQQQGPAWKGVVGMGVKEAFMQPGTLTRKLASSPTAQARALPYLAGAAGGASGLPMGTTAGTAIGRGLSDLALKSYGRSDLIPSPTQQGLEIGGAALGDVMAVPFMHKARLGSQIGEAERGAGVIARAAPKAITPGSVGETLNTLEAQVDAGTINTAQGARDAKEIVDQIYMNPKIYEKSPGIEVQSARVSKKVQSLLNSLIEGRGEPAKKMATAMKVPNMIREGYRAMPWAIKRGAQFIGAGAVAEEILRKIYGK